MSEPTQDARTHAAGPRSLVDEGTPSSISLSKIGWSSMLSLVVLLVITYYTFEFDEFRRLVTQIHPGPLVAALGAVFLRIFFGGWRLSYISHGRMSMAEGTRAQLAWDFFSNVTPSAIGGGPFAAIYIARDREFTVGEATAIMLFAMLLDQFWFAVVIPPLLLAMPFVAVLPETLGSAGTIAFVGLFLGMMVWVGVFGYAVLVRPRVLHRIVDVCFRLRWLRRFRPRLRREMNQLEHQARVLRTQPPRFFVKGFLLTAGVWLSRFVLPLCIILAFYPGVDEWLVFIRTAAMQVGTIVLPTPGGSGGIEGLYMLLLGPPLMPAALVAPTLLVWRVLGYYLFLGLGVYLSMHHVRQSMNRRRAAQTHVAVAPARPEAIEPAMEVTEAP